MKAKSLVSLLLSLVMTSCSTPDIEDYKGSKPEFDFVRFFKGQTHGHGIFQDFSGKVIRHFEVDIKGEFDQDKGKLHESFKWEDGSDSTRIWEVTLGKDGSITGQASDGVGLGQGRAVGQAFQFEYVLKILAKGSEREFSFDDWMYQVTDDVVINKAKMKKWGLTVGEVTLYLKKLK